MSNHLYYGDNLAVLRDSIKDASVDLIHLDPPFNSNASYNVLFKGPQGNDSAAQIEAFGNVMPSSRSLAAIRGLFAFWLSCFGFCTAAYSDTAESYLGRCMDVSEVFEIAPQILLGEGFSIFQMEKEYGARHLLLAGQGVPATAPTANWFLVSRENGDASEYCVADIGKMMEPLASLHESNFDERYGVPGSGYERCSKEGDPLGSVKVRAWATRELGDSVVMSFSDAANKMGAHTLIVSKLDGAWILLQKQKTGQSCYFDRGPASKSGGFSYR